ncbi:MAG: hypothetical protein WAR57_08795 [Candidatus Phosphoribacter sp.]
MSSTQCETLLVTEIGPQFTTVLPLSHLAVVCWQATSSERRAAHARHGRSICPTSSAPYGEADPHGASVKETCLIDDCLDLFHEVLLGVGARLERRWATAPPPTDAVRYAASIVPTLLVDRQRTARVAKGWAAKPARADGTAASVNRQLLATAPDEPSGQWYVILFRIMRAYANSEGRFSAVWPVDGLTQEKARHLATTSSTGDRTTVLEDIRHVLASAQDAAGRAWVNQIIWQPLVSGVALAPLPDDVLAPGGDLEDQVLTAWFRDEYTTRRRRGLSVRESFRAAASTISGRRTPDPDATLIGLLHDIEAASPR